MKLKELFQNNQMLKRIDDLNPLKGTWIHNNQKGVCNIQELDTYLLMTIGERRLSRFVIDTSYIPLDEKIRNFINVNEYRLSNLWETILFEYNPIDNYDRTETQTHNENIVTADHETESVTGARNQTNTNGSRTDTSTTSDSTTSFDGGTYAKPTNQSTSQINNGSSTDTMSIQSATDTVTQKGYNDTSNGGYTLRARGNIGTMATQTMIEMERNIVNYVFFDEIVKLFELYLLDNNYEEWGEW